MEKKFDSGRCIRSGTVALLYLLVAALCALPLAADDANWPAECSLCGGGPCQAAGYANKVATATRPNGDFYSGYYHNKVDGKVVEERLQVPDPAGIDDAGAGAIEGGAGLGGGSSASAAALPESTGGQAGSSAPAAALPENTGGQVGAGVANNSPAGDAAAGSAVTAGADAPDGEKVPFWAAFTGALGEARTIVVEAVGARNAALVVAGIAVLVVALVVLAVIGAIRRRFKGKRIEAKHPGGPPAKPPESPPKG